MSGQQREGLGQGLESADISTSFDRPHLARYTLDNDDLEKEIIGLFLQQLPSIVAMLEQAETAAEWKMATHTLKGSAAAVGATAIHASAIEMEGHGPFPSVYVKINLMSDLRQRVELFQAVIGKLYPA